MSKSKIEWTEKTWNPVSGCTKISPGCKHCYAERMWCRLSAKNMPYHGRKFSDIALHSERLGDPLRWRKPTKVFVNSMSDLFHEAVPFNFITDVFAVMAMAETHTFQVLTKRPERMLEYFEKHYSRDDLAEAAVVNIDHWDDPDNVHDSVLHSHFPLKNVWLGVSVEDQTTADHRIPILINSPAAVNFLSIEPLLEDITDINLTGIDWVIVGGESGPRARPCALEWIENIIEQCKAASVPVFVKQLGAFVVSESRICAETDEEAYKQFGWGSKYAQQAQLAHKKGADPGEWPKNLQIREYPI